MSENIETNNKIYGLFNDSKVCICVTMDQDCFNEEKSWTNDSFNQLKQIREDAINDFVKSLEATHKSRNGRITATSKELHDIALKAIQPIRSVKNEK